MSYRQPNNKYVLTLVAILLVVSVISIGQPTFASSTTSKKATPASKLASKSSSKSKSKLAKCDSNYSGCVPVASDVDCKPGSGNGPKYTTGPKKVIKKDIYKLDTDKDHIACEKN